MAEPFNPSLNRLFTLSPADTSPGFFLSELFVTFVGWILKFKRMKRFVTLFVAAALVSVASCSDGPVAEDGAEELVKGKIVLNADRTVICADGVDAVTFTVTVTDENGQKSDVTEDAEIYTEQDVLMEGTSFATDKVGEYGFYAVYGLSLSESVNISALATIPVIPADPEDENLEFRHRMLIVQHTGATCPNCPLMMISLKQLSENEDYAGAYNLVASHSYNDGISDAAYSPAARTLSATFNSGSYPELTFNLTKVNVGHGYDDICGQVGLHMRDSAPAGIAVAVDSSAHEVVANVEIKFAEAGDYRVGAWLLEDDIFAVQSGASESWQHTHDNALRVMYGDKPTECIYGLPVGNKKSGDKYEKLFRFPLEKEWRSENCRVLVFVTKADADGNFDIANCAVCDMCDVESYDYK